MKCPFLAGFHSKDLIIELLYISEVGIFLLFIILISLSLTVIYSLRLFFYSFFTKSMNFISARILSESKLINYSMILLVVSSMVRGSLLNWLFFYNLEVIYLYVSIKFKLY